MSQDYQIAIVPVVTPRQDVSSNRQEVISLADVFGRVPVEELQQVLASAWAVANGYQTVAEGTHYRRVIGNGVALEVRVDGGQVELRRNITSQSVPQSEASQVRQAQESAMAGTDAAYDQAINELLVRTMVAAVPNRAREMGYVVAEEVATHGPNEVIDVVLHVELAV